jgi:plastocyanin
VRRTVAIAAIAGLGAFLVPTGARAAVQTLTFRSAPIRVDAFAVARGAERADSPQVDGAVVAMSADLVDAEGKPVPNHDVMLHHVVFGKVLYPDYTCTSFRGYDGRAASLPAQRFYAEGEEHNQLALPPGYGYPNRGTDIWGLLYMLMNHHARTQTVYVRYTVTYATNEGLVPVQPIWLDVRNCEADPIFNVAGTRGPGSTYERHADVRIPEDGQLVSGGAHLHGGGLYLDISDTTCGVSLYRSYPTWGGIEPRPIIHEPGPLAMTAFLDPLGRPVRAGDDLRITAAYDNSRPHVRVMGIALVYLAPGPAGPCTDYASPVPAPTTPEQVTVQLLKRPVGRVARVRGTWVGDYAYGAQRVSIRRGTTFTWRFVGQVAHDVTLASGPAGFASPSLDRGTYRHRFTRPGVYRLFCSLHPARMTQVVTVR